MSKYILAINSISDPIEISLLKDFKLINEKKYKKKNNEAKKLLFVINELLKENNIQISEIKNIAVVIGEGSYTGTRIGVSVANALAYGLDIKIIEIVNDELNNCSISRFLTNQKEKNYILKEMVFPIYSKPPTITHKN